MIVRSYSFHVSHQYTLHVIIIGGETTHRRCLVIESKMGITSPELHQLHYFLHSELYDRSVPFHHKADLILKAFSEMPEDMSAHLILSRKLVVGFP